MSIEKDNIKYDSKNNFIIMKTYRDANKERMTQAFNRILEMSEVENCKNILIDATKTTKLPSIENLYSVGSSMSLQAKKLFKMRVAFVISDEISNDWQFFNTVLANRMVHFQTFKNVDDAKEWLLN